MTFAKRNGIGTTVAVAGIAAILAFGRYGGKQEDIIKPPVAQVQQLIAQIPKSTPALAPVQAPNEVSATVASCPVAPDCPPVVEIPRCGDGTCDKEETRKPVEGKVWCPEDCKPEEVAKVARRAKKVAVSECGPDVDTSPLDLALYRYSPGRLDSVRSALGVDSEQRISLQARFTVLVKGTSELVSVSADSNGSHADVTGLFGGIKPGKVTTTVDCTATARARLSENFQSRE